MSYKAYKVIVHDTGCIEWYYNGKTHREDGPAVTYPDVKAWYLNGQHFVEASFNQAIKNKNTNETSCEGKVVEIDGKKYKLTAV